MGKRAGRLCLFYQVDLGEDTLEYDTINTLGHIYGEIKSNDDLFYSTGKLLEFYKTDKVDLVLKYIRLQGTRISGVCPKSYPKSDLSIRLLGKLNICLGGSNGTELVHLPYEGTIFDQPNIFIEAFYIWVDEFNKYIKSKPKPKQNENR